VRSAGRGARAAGRGAECGGRATGIVWRHGLRWRRPLWWGPLIATSG